MSLRLEPLGAGQAEAAQALVREVWRGVFDGTPDAQLAGYFDDDAALADLADPEHAYGSGGLLLSVLDGEALVGLGGVQRVDGQTAELKRIMLRPGARGQGAGRRLVAALLDHARAQGFRRVRLHTHPRLAASRALYAAFGCLPIAPFTDLPAGMALHLGIEFGD